MLQAELPAGLPDGVSMGVPVGLPLVACIAAEIEATVRPAANSKMRRMAAGGRWWWWWWGGGEGSPGEGSGAVGAAFGDAARMRVAQARGEQNADMVKRRGAGVDGVDVKGTVVRAVCGLSALHGLFKCPLRPSDFVVSIFRVSKSLQLI